MMADSQYEEAEVNFFRLLKVFVNSVNEALRICFVQQWHKMTGIEWKNEKRCGQCFVDLERAGSKRKSKLFTAEYAKTLDLISEGIVEKWDSTTLFFALLYSRSVYLADPAKGYRKVAICRVEPFTLGEHIDHLRKIRNSTLFHADEPRIRENSEFVQKMNSIIIAVSSITGKDHKIVKDIIKLRDKRECVLESSGRNSLGEILLREKESHVNFRRNWEQLEQQVEQSLCCVKEKTGDGTSSSENKKHTEVIGEFEGELNSEKLIPEGAKSAKETSGTISEKRVKLTSAKLRDVQKCVVEIMYPNRPELDEEYKKLINTSNKFSYEFDWKNFNAFIGQTFHEKSEDCDMILFAKIQLAKGLSHQGQKQEALELLNGLISQVYKAKNSAVLLARIFYRLAYIFHDLKDAKNALQYIFLAEQILVTSQSYEDLAEIQYAKANITMATCTDDEQQAVVNCLNNTIEATQKSVVDMSVLERQASLRNSLVHVGYLQHSIKTNINLSDVKTASVLFDKFQAKCHGKMSKRNQLFQLICQSLLAYYQNEQNLAVELGDRAYDIAVNNGLHYELKQIMMLKSHLKLPHDIM